MRNHYYCILLFIISFCAVRGQHTCAEPSNFCVGSSALTFASSAMLGNAESGIDYDCMFTQPNPYWFNIAVGESGNLNFQLSQTNASGTLIDVDYILLG